MPSAAQTLPLWYSGCGLRCGNHHALKLDLLSIRAIIGISCNPSRHEPQKIGALQMQDAYYSALFTAECRCGQSQIARTVVLYRVSWLRGFKPWSGLPRRNRPVTILPFVSAHSCATVPDSHWIPLCFILRSSDCMTDNNIQPQWGFARGELAFCAGQNPRFSMRAYCARRSPRFSMRLQCSRFSTILESP